MYDILFVSLDGGKILSKKLIIITVIAIFLVFNPISVIFINNMRLDNFAEQLFGCPLPFNTEIVETHKEAGNMNMTGDNFGFWVYIVINTDLSESEIIDYYNHSNFRGGKYLRLDVIPYNLAEQSMSYTYRRNKNSDIATDNRYIIQLYDHDDSIWGILDIRRV